MTDPDSIDSKVILEEDESKQVDSESGHENYNWKDREKERRSRIQSGINVDEKKKAAL